jgi:hypothetical protein
MPPSAWKDYAASGNGHHTNYAYEPFDPDPRGGGGGGALPPPPGAPRGHHPQMAPQHHNGSLQRPRPAGGYSRAPHPQAGFSLPRPVNGSGGYGGPPPPPPGYGSYDRRGYHGRPPPGPPGHMPPDFAPDHYFMPSQRKYSGEVVRVFVDYNNK